MSDKKNMRYTYQIYKICSDYCDKFYIGSTRDFTNRKSKHKGACNNVNNKGHNLKVYRTIRENQGWENWNMVCIEIMENTTKLEAEIREEQWRMQLKATLNDKMVTRGHMTREEYKKQYNEEHKDHYKEYYKQYKEEHKDYYKEYNKKYCEENREHLKEQKKQYREENIEHIKEWNKLYREENREQIRAKKNQKHDCECGGKYTHNHKARHSKSIKHQKYLDTLGKSI